MAKTEFDAKKALENIGITQLNEMQLAVKGAYNKNKNLMVLSPTGSGKTLAFLLPILAHLDEKKPGVQVLILSPARELALQLEEVFRSLKSPFKVNCCYGGHDFKIERNNLSVAPAVLIGTPGRILDHINKETFDPKTITHIVFDEYDKSLEFGFASEMEKINSELRGIKKRLFTSATKTIELPLYVHANEVKELDFLTNSKHVSNLKLYVVKAADTEKLESLFQLICSLDYKKQAIIFCNHRDAVDRISEHLAEYGIVTSAFHGGMDQNERERTLTMFKNGSSHILVTTDLAARGLDISAVEYVIHYQKPPKLAAFTHRNGRTARMQSSGSAFIMLTDKDERPDYLPRVTKEYKFGSDAIVPEKPQWATVCFSRGKKDKINKIDLVGFLSKIGGLKPDEIGLITVFDFVSYVAIDRKRSNKLIKAIKGLKIKNKSVRTTLYTR